MAVPELSTTGSFSAQVMRSGEERQRATRFLNRATWAIIVVLAGIAAAIWISPIARATGHTTIQRVLGVSFLLEFFALIAIVAVLRRRLAAEVVSLGEQQSILVRQHERMRAVSDQMVHLNRRLAVAQEVAKLGYWEIDDATGEVFWSVEMYRLAGLEPSTAPAPTDKFIEVVHPEDRAVMQQVAANAISNLTEFAQEYRLCVPGQPMRYVQAQGRIVVDDTGRRRLVGTVQDISDRMELEAKLRHSQKLEAVGQLAGGVAHDFNNLLTVIEGYSSLLLLEQPDPAGAKPYVEEIQGAAKRASALTRQLLAFSRQQVLQPRVIDVNELVDGVSSLLRRLIGEHIHFHTTLTPDVGRVKVDPGQLEMVLMNLAVNARDAMPNGGTLTIETGNVVLDAAYAQRHPVKQLGPHVMLAVSDTGHGIKKEDLDRIFEPFFTTKESGKGTGLGLATVHGVVQQSGGHIWVYSEVGRGTTFKVYLPVAEHPIDHVETPALEPVKAAPAKPRHAAILLVEDDSALRQMTTNVLRRAGADVIAVSDGVEAVRVCHDSSTPIDLVISDMVMPSMGGRELLRELRRLRPTVPALLMSGYTRDAMVNNNEVPDSVEFIEKPFTPESLTQRVSDMLDRHANGRLVTAALERVSQSSRPPNGGGGGGGGGGGATETVLLVDDDDRVRATVAQMLHSQGYRVVEATNGDDAIEQAGRLRAPIHLVLTDVVMPQSNGRDLFEQLRRWYPSLRILFMSGFTRGAIEVRDLQDGLTGFLPKPFTAEDLSRAVRKLLDSAPQQTHV